MAEEQLSELLQIRRDKLAQLQAQGQDPFHITKYEPTHTARQILDDYDALEGQPVTVAGRIMSDRGMGKVSFRDLQDRTGRIQIYMRRDDVDEAMYDAYKRYDIGDIVGIQGTVFRTKRGEISVRAEQATLLSKSLLPLLLLGMCEPVIYFFGEQYGILHSSTVFSGVMIALIPIASTMTAIPVLGEKPTLRQILYSLLSVGGVIGIGLLTNNSGSLDWIGVAGLLVAVFSAVGYNLLSRGISAQYTPFERTYVMLGIGALVFTGIALISVHGDGAAYLQPLGERSYVLSILFLSVCCSVISFFLSSYILTQLTIARATVFANLTTAISVFAGVVFLHEPFSVVGLICCAAILFGIYGVQHAAEE